VPSCFDSWAVLSWLDGDEPAASAVDEVLKRERPAMSWINLVEVHYRTARDHGKNEADRVLDELRSRITEHLPGVSAMRAAASLKAEYPMALADCFAVALATNESAVLMTGDPEITDQAKGLPCEVKDLRTRGFAAPPDRGLP
jgi:predicted nucleic acid-binding protein